MKNMGSDEMQFQRSEEITKHWFFQRMQDSTYICFLLLQSCISEDV